MDQPAQRTDRFGERWMNIVWRKPPADIAERTRRRVMVHLIPFLFFLYILAYLDRVNVSVAQLQLTQSVEKGGMGFTDEAVGIGFGLFFWGYWVLEIPSTVSVVKWGARYVFVRILVLWGLCATAVGFVGMPGMNHVFGWLPMLPTEWPLVGGAFGWVNSLRDNPLHQLYFLRVMLGFFEGGFFPSVIVYLSLWFRPQDRAKAIACFMIAIPLSSALGYPVSGMLLEAHWFGLPGWRWIFITEGILPVLAGIATWFLLANRPADARWLPKDEGEWLTSELEKERATLRAHSHWGWHKHFGMVLILTMVYFGLNVVAYGLNSFMPAIIKAQSGFGDRWSSILAAMPYVMSFLGMLVVGWHSDKTGERPWHVAIPLFLLGCGVLVVSLVFDWKLLPVLVLIFWVGGCLYTYLPPFWPIPTMFLGATAAAGAIGFINMIGNLGGSVGPYLIGKAKTQDANFAGGLLRLAPWPIMSAAIVLIVAYVKRRKPTKE
ncbi:MAG TPA: MFS transporter [Pirellulales bacterium]|jgi:ACS family tartrate transporter-like MFS transporter